MKGYDDGKLTLRHESNVETERLLRQISNVVTIDEDASARRFVEAIQQPHDRALASARRADEGDRLAFLDLERDALEHVLFPVVREHDVLELDLSALALVGIDLELDRVGSIDDVFVLRKECHELFRVDEGLHRLSVQGSNPVERRVELIQVRDERDCAMQQKRMRDEC